MENTYPFRAKYFFHANLFFVLLVSSSRFGSSQKWDGVVVTQADYQALRAIKHELLDLRGFLRTWNDSGYGACSGGWIGIKCVKGEVIAIQLPWKGLGGRISEKIGQLQELRKISMHDNALAGSIPQSLGFLPNLRGVYLFNNRLSGSIPPSIGNCPVLQALDVSNNLLIGAIPPSVAKSTRLYRLNLSFNSLTGSIPATLTRPRSLIFLDLQHNNLSGTIPDSWGGAANKSYQLQFLNLDHNGLSGTLPVTLGKLDLLQEISLGHNQISGTIPSELGRLSRLQKLDLSNNAISGSFPSSFSNLSSLVSLNLEGNRLDNQLPEAFDRLHNLSVLNLKNNKLKGPIPATFRNLSGIHQLDLSQNNFSGQIPASLAQLPALTSLNVSYNNLSGAVPSVLSKKFNSSSFVGNLELCGYSVSTQCASPPPAIVPAPAPEAPKHGHRKLSIKDISLIAGGALLAVLLLLCCIMLCCLMRKRAAGAEIETGGEMGGKLVHFDGPFVFTADDLLCATAEIMGKSTYGTAYKATLEDGNQVAVKRLREKTTKGQREFETEAAAIGKIRHPNLLALRAYYLGPKGEKLLVFDYMPRGSLSSFLHGNSWTGDHYQLASSNILLDEQNNAHIADFGISRLMTAAANTNVIATAGTLGYRAPELSKLKNANTKTDVYSLGVIILELLTGKSPAEAMNGMDLPQWVASIVKEEWTNEVFDLELMRDAPNIGDELLNTLKLALHCVDPSPMARPEAEQVIQQLEEIRPELSASGADNGAEAAAAAPTNV